jgi:hypothetical protein
VNDTPALDSNLTLIRAAAGELGIPRARLKDGHERWRSMLLPAAQVVGEGSAAAFLPQRGSAGWYGRPSDSGRKRASP